MPSPRILLIDDHALFRAGLGMVVTMALPQATILQANSIDEALAHTETASVVLLDIQLGNVSGLEGIALLRAKWPQVPVLMLSAYDEPETARLALERGAVAFISKAESPEKIIGVLQQILRGEWTPGAQPSVTANDTARKLTPRQREVLQLLHLGLSNKLIARQLNLSDNTVRRHVQDILEYLHVVSRAEAVAVARAQFLVN